MKVTTQYCDLCGVKIPNNNSRGGMEIRISCESQNPLFYIKGSSGGAQDTKFAIADTCHPCSKRVAQAVADTVTAIREKLEGGQP